MLRLGVGEGATDSESELTLGGARACMPLSASEPAGMQTQAMMQPPPDVTVTGTPVPHGGYHPSPSHDELTGGGSDARAGGHEKGPTESQRLFSHCLKGRQWWRQTGRR